MESIAVIARAANGLDTEPFRGDRIHLAVAMARDQRLGGQVRPFDEGRHEMLSVPHGENDGEVGNDALVDVGRFVPWHHPTGQGVVIDNGQRFGEFTVEDGHARSAPP